MKTSALSEHSSFLDKDFRDDLGILASANEAAVHALRDWIASLNEYDDTEDTKKWIPLVKETGKTIEELQALFRPVRYISFVCSNDHIPVADLLDDLSEAGAITDHGLRSRLEQLLGPLEKLVKPALQLAAPSLPLLRIKSIQTRCILVSEYDKEFNTDEDTPETYSPAVDALHPMVLLELHFWDKEQPRIGVSLSEGNLDTLTNWLALAKVQLFALKKAIPPCLLPERRVAEQQP